MRRGRAVVLCALTASGLPPLACASARINPPAAYAADSLTGVLSIAGTSFEKRLLLSEAGVAARLRASAADSEALSRLAGMRIRVFGTRDRDEFAVREFIALSVENRPVVDGVLAINDGKLILMSGGRSILLGNPPSNLRAMIGARVWIEGPLETGPNAYGVIVPARK